MLQVKGDRYAGWLLLRKKVTSNEAYAFFRLDDQWLSCFPNPTNHPHRLSHAKGQSIRK